MLTIRAARNPGYYETPEFARDDYYTERGGTPGQWTGRGAETLGLAGSPSRGQLEQLLCGENPATNERLHGLREGRRNAGFDLTWTAPKSISVLHAVGDDRVRAEVLAAHQAGVRSGMDYLERFECQARRGAGGHQIVEAGGFVGAAFTHELSRTGDPHLHTHQVIANAVQGPEGRWSAQDMRPVFSAAKTAGTIAEAVTRAQLTDRLGVRWGEGTKGTAEIDGVPSEVLVEFSRRRAEITELALSRGVEGIQAVGSVQRETRDRKPTLDRDIAVGEWRARAAEHGLGRYELDSLHDRHINRELTPVEAREFGEQLAGPEGLTRQASTFDRRAILRAFAERHQHGITLPEVEALADRWSTEHAVPITPAVPEVGVRARWSTPDMLDTEERLVTLARRRVPGQTVTPRIVEEILALHPEAGLDQVHAVRELAAGFGPVRVMVARAGTGKTYTLGLTREAFDQADIPVVGCAWQGQAAQVLETDAGIPSRTVASLLGEVAHRPEIALPEHGVLIVDEAGTVPTRALAELLERAAERDVTVLLVGDPRQLPSINAGGALRGIADRVGSVELTENRRQVGDLQRDIAGALGEGHPREALDLLVEHGRIQTRPTPEAAREALIKAWAENALDDPSRVLILAHDRVDVRELNRLARDVMDQAGLLGPDRLEANGREWAVGDRLVCRRNDYRPDLDVRNGTRATVTQVDLDERELTIRTDDGRPVRLPEDYLQHAHHAYATTGHISQGITVDWTYLFASLERGGLEWAYVVASRHRIDLHLFTVGDKPDLAIDALSRGWQRTQAKTLAIDSPAPALTAEPATEFTIGGSLTPRTPRIEPPSPEFRIGGSLARVERLRCLPEIGPPGPEMGVDIGL